MHAIATLLFLLTLPNPLTTLVLRSGERLKVEGQVRHENGVVVFRAAGGNLYSMPLDEIDLEASRVASAPVKEEPPPPPAPKKKLQSRLTDADRKRIIAELQQNHRGTPPPKQQTAITTAPSPKTESEVRQEQAEERDWRRQARTHEESIRRSQENVVMLRQTAERLRGEIASLIALGYKPSQFSYQTTRLEATTEQIPWAELEVERAQRAYAEFRDDARKQGILPGWLR